MTARQPVHRDETGPYHRHDHELGDPIPDRDRIRPLAVGIEKGDPDFASVARIHCSRAVDDGDPVPGGEATARQDECGVPVRQGYRDPGADGRALTRSELDRLGSGEVGASVAGVPVGGERLGDDQDFNGIDHPTRLVQSGRRKVWSNGPMTTYRERLTASPWMFIATALVIPASLLVFLPISMVAGVVVAAVLYGGCVLLLIWGSPVIEVADGVLTAGRARLPLSAVAQATAYRSEEATLERGRRLDARAWLLIRGWVSPVVKVQLDDPSDPTPYWILSSRRPEQLVAAIESAKAAVGS